jgi:hypothetical protein
VHRADGHIAFHDSATVPPLEGHAAHPEGHVAGRGQRWWRRPEDDLHGLVLLPQRQHRDLPRLDHRPARGLAQHLEAVLLDQLTDVTDGDGHPSLATRVDLW